MRKREKKLDKTHKKEGRKLGKKHKNAKGQKFLNLKLLTYFTYSAIIQSDIRNAVDLIRGEEETRVTKT